MSTGLSLCMTLLQQQQPVKLKGTRIIDKNGCIMPPCVLILNHCGGFCVSCGQSGQMGDGGALTLKEEESSQLPVYHDCAIFSFSFSSFFLMPVI